MKIQTRYCAFCKSEEGKQRLIGHYIVKLKELKTKRGVVMACQSCRQKTRIIMNKKSQKETKMKKNWIEKIRISGLIILNMAVLLVATSSVILAQPGLPNAPSQAPIDGGLGLLAAAGGAYALKKLRDKRKQGEELE